MVPVVIAESESESAEVVIPPGSTVGPVGSAIVGIVMPNAWTAADLTFAVDPGDGTPRDVYGQDGTELTVTVTAADSYIAVDPISLIGVGRLIVRSGTSGTPVAQEAARTLYLVTRRFA